MSTTATHQIAGRGAAPVVGITGNLERCSWGDVWTKPVTMLQRTYTRAVVDAGGVALILASDTAAHEHVDLLLDRIDGVIFAGGADIAPERYGAVVDPATGAPEPERDSFELTLARQALARDIPLLGICRGMQLLNVVHGGTLWQDLPAVVGHEHHRVRRGEFSNHEVELSPGTLVATAAGETLHGVKSHHHQGVATLGEGLVATGWSTLDRMIEAIERPDRVFALGVLWHPEEDPASRLVAALVVAAHSLSRKAVR